MSGILQSLLSGNIVTISSAGFNTSTSANINFGSISLQANDLILLFQRSGRSGTTPPISVNPSGFTVISDLSITGSNNYSYRTIISYKKATGSETTLTGMNASGFDRKILQVFRPSINCNYAIQSLNQQITDTTNPSNQTIISGSSTKPSVATAFYGSSEVMTAGFTPTAQSTITSDNNIVKYSIFNTNPSDETISLSTVGRGRTLVSFYVTFTAS